MISQAVIEEIMFRCDIVNVISSHMKLQRSGSGFKGLCPFHSEKTPSFSVSPTERLFYCFGCGAGGSVITFVERTQNLDFVSAVQVLAAQAGITIDLGDEAPTGPRRSRIFEINRTAAKFFHDQLSTPAGRPALEYLQRRGINPHYIRHFGLGFAPKGNALSAHLRKEGFTTEEIIAACLSKQSEDRNNETYDFFRNRIIFPIIDVSGKVIAFGGRAMNDDNKAKYLNSSDTVVFKKNRNLFSMNFARHHCKDQIILCEGYMDVIALYCAGVKNGVAALGTAFGAEQARMISKYSSNVVIAYDSDDAGQRAAAKAFELFAEVGLPSRILKLEGAKDPDDYIKMYGADAFNRLLSNSKTQFEWSLENILKAHDLTQMDERVKAANAVADLIAVFRSSVEREVYIASAATTLGVTHDSLKTDVERKIKAILRKQKNDEREKLLTDLRGIGDRVNAEYTKNPAAAAAEEAVLGILLLHPEHFAHAVDKQGLTEDDFVTDLNRRVFATIAQQMQENGKFAEGMLPLHFTNDEVGRIYKIKVRRMQLSDNGENELTQCIAKLRENKPKSDDTASILDTIQKKRQL
ncbi:MAG: DNA primase [Oscillospiraceae bacterium]|nr:DNA primase [Oscillospiraceae bacterium]